MRTELHGLLATKHHLPLWHLPLFATACCLLTHLTVASLMSGQKTLDAPFFAKMGRLLALWRLRRAVSAVRVLLFLNSKMHRLRALWKFRRSSSIASMIGSSWVRRAREIRFGAAIERLQACITISA